MRRSVVKCKELDFETVVVSGNLVGAVEEEDTGVVEDFMVESSVEGSAVEVGVVERSAVEVGVSEGSAVEVGVIEGSAGEVGVVE